MYPNTMCTVTILFVSLFCGFWCESELCGSIIRLGANERNWTAYSGFSFMDKLEQKYAAERDKRLAYRPEGEAQYIDLQNSDVYSHLLKDPWAPAASGSTPLNLTSESLRSCKHLILEQV
jgi:hypothetical protein